MKVLNLDDLAKTTRTLTLDGVQHEVLDMTVGAFIEATKNEEKMKKASLADQFENAVKMVHERVPTLSEERLKKLNFDRLTIILKFITGELDGEQKAEEAPEEGKEVVKGGKGRKK